MLMHKSFPSIFWLWIPVVAFVIQIILEMTLSGHVLSHLHSENSLHETLQAVVIFTGFLVAVRAVFSRYTKDALLKAWFILAAFCCLYVAGEEISWGQHIMDWTTPDYWGGVNDQQETNLHNTSSWLDQKPRLILLVGIVFGGLIAPYLQYKNLLKLPEKLAFLMPSTKLSVIALFVVVPQLFEKKFELFDIYIFTRFSEVQELYMFYFVLLYLVMLYQKAKLQEEA